MDHLRIRPAKIPAPASVMDAFKLIVLANQYIPVSLSLPQAARGFHLIILLAPLLAYAVNQGWFRKHKSAWATEAKHMLRTVFGEAHEPGNKEYDLPHEGVGERITEEYEEICEALHLKGDTNVDLM